MSDEPRRSDAAIAVIICSYGRDDLTRQTLADLGLSRQDHVVCVVDNMGDLEVRGGPTMHLLRPSTNLGWARGSNLGLRTMVSRTTCGAFVLLNNDVRLSSGFLDGLHDAWLATNAAVIGPAYDHNWPHQRIQFDGPPSEYVPRTVDRAVPFVDGTCMLISRRTIESIGLLDEDHWPEWGWGCDKDYALRARLAGGSVYVTERAYLSHLGRGTAASLPLFSEAAAEAENDAGMTVRWGMNWRDRLFAGFDDCSRSGLTQELLGKHNLRP